MDRGAKIMLIRIKARLRQQFPATILELLAKGRLHARTPFTPVLAGSHQGLRHVAARWQAAGAPPGVLHLRVRAQLEKPGRNARLPVSVLSASIGMPPLASAAALTSSCVSGPTMTCAPSLRA